MFELKTEYKFPGRLAVQAVMQADRLDICRQGMDKQAGRKVGQVSGQLGLAGRHAGQASRQESGQAGGQTGRQKRVGCSFF